MTHSTRPIIGVIASGARQAAGFAAGFEALDAHGAPYEVLIAPADSAPDWAADWAAEAEGRGLEAILVLASPGDALPAFVAAHAEIPTFALLVSEAHALPAPPASLGEAAPVAWVCPPTPAAAVMLLFQTLSLADPRWTGDVRRLRDSARERVRREADQWRSGVAAATEAPPPERPAAPEPAPFEPRLSIAREREEAIASGSFEPERTGQAELQPSPEPKTERDTWSDWAGGPRVSEAGIWDAFSGKSNPPDHDRVPEPPREPVHEVHHVHPERQPAERQPAERQPAERPPVEPRPASTTSRVARREPSFIGRVRINSDILPPDLVEQTADLLLDGGVIALPTDTVYGLAVDATNEEAARRLYQIKERSSEKSIAIFVDTPRALNQIVTGLNSQVRAMLEAFWPGPLTVVFEKRGASFRHLTALDTIGVRIPDHPIPLALVQELRRPLACTSANISGLPEARSADEVEEYFGRNVDMTLDAGRLPQSPVSTVIDVSRSPYRILRQGAISHRQLAAVLGDLLSDE